MITSTKTVLPPKDYNWAEFDIKKFDPFAHDKRPVKVKGLKFTNDEVRTEVYKCSQSFAYFCRNYATVVHPTEGNIKFDLRPYQERIAFQYQVYRFTTMRKPRQVGCSSLAAIYLLWCALFNESFSAIVLSIGGRESIEFLKKLYDAYDRLPRWLAGELKENNKHTIVFDNDSRIQSLPSPKTGTARSYSCSVLVIDEAAFIHNAEVIWTAAFPVISTGGKVMVLSTVNGVFGNGKWFYDTWMDAIEGNNTFFPIDIHWSENPEYTEEWAANTRKNIGEKAWAQEYECNFAGSVETFLPRHAITKLIDKSTTTIKDPIMKLDNDMFWIWEHEDPREMYVMACDVAKIGTGKSNSSFHIIKLSTMEQVAEFQGRKGDTKISTSDYAKAINKYGRLYNNAYCMVELENIGHSVLVELFEYLHYPNLHFYKEGTPGWSTNPTSRGKIINALYEAFDKNLITIHSIRTLREMQTFVEDPDTGKVQKQKGSTDDLLIALGIALNGVELAERSKSVMGLVLDNRPKDTMTDEELRQLRKEELTLNKKTNLTHEIKLPDGSTENIDLSWLY